MTFNLFLAGRISFGPGVSSLVGEKATALGGKRIFLVTDRTMEKLGTAEKISTHLSTAGLSTVAFFDVEPEPSVETVDTAAALAKEHGCDIVVGLGGGSCLDVAKAVSVLLTNEGSAAQYQGLGLVKRQGVPKIMIPTTAGTGSEATFTAVLIRKSDGVKGGINGDQLYPECSLLDPELTFSMPPHVTATTGMDALAHALEAYTSKQASPFSDMFAEEAISRIGRYLRVAVYNGTDLKARSEMMLAAFYGGVALANAGVTACHALAYPLGGMFGIGHGQANALLLPYVAQFNAMALPEKFAAAAQLLGGSFEENNLRESASMCSALLHQLVADIDLPATFSALDPRITGDHFTTMAEKAMGVARPMANNPRTMNTDLCVSIYREAM
jgi:alcohol dehydrogenase